MSSGKTLEWKRAIRQFVHANANILTIAAVCLIVFEGSVIWFYPDRWWQPLVVLLALLALAIAWKNLKSVVKFLVSIGVTIMIAALAIQSGYYLTATSIGGSTWGLSILSTWALSVFLSYVIVSTRSRWGVALTASIIGFLVSYSFMSLGVLPITIACVTSGTLASIIISKSDVLQVNSKRAFKLMRDWDHKRMDDVMISLWPGMTSTVWRINKHGDGVIYHGEGCPTIVIIPIDLDESFELTARHGLTYHGRDVRRKVLWLESKAFASTGDPAPVIILADVNSMNQQTHGSYSVISVPRVDATTMSYVGVLDVTGSRRQLHDRVAGLVGKFSGVEKATAKQEKKLEKRLATSKKRTKKPADGKTVDTSTVMDNGHDKNNSADHKTDSKDSVAGLDEKALDSALDSMDLSGTGRIDGVPMG